MVLFSGTVRDHADGRDGVESLTYEAYDDQVMVRFDEIVAETRRRWPDTGRIVIWHRTGRLEVRSRRSSPSSRLPRAEAFEAGRYRSTR